MDQHNIICPITKQIFLEPALADDGNVYEKDAIEEWLRNKLTSPLTRQKMSDRVVPVNFVRIIVNEFLEKNPELKTKQYTTMKDFAKYRSEVFEHIANNRFEKLLCYRNYNVARLVQQLTNIAKEPEISYLKYLFKNCKDESIINYIIDNIDEMDTNFRLYMAEYSSEELNTKYIDKSNYHNIKSTYLWNPLHFFIKRGFINIIEGIGNIHTFKKLNIKTKRGFTPLMMAIKYNPEAINILLKYNMPVSINDIKYTIKNNLNQNTIIGMYDKCKDADDNLIIIPYIYRYKKNQEYRDFIENIIGKVPDVSRLLGVLCPYVSNDIIKMFIDKGCNVNTFDKKNEWSNWMHALNLSRYNLFRYMLPNIDFTIKSKLGNGMIQWLADEANYELIKEITDRYEFNFNEVVDNKTPLFRALINNSSKVCRLLIEKGADVNVQLEDNSHILCAMERFYDDIEFLKFIMSKCNNFEIVCKGEYLINYAGLHCKPELIKFMVDLNINLENMDKGKQKLIHNLCSRCDGNDYENLIKYLIDVKKVSVEDYNIYGFKPIHYIFCNGSFEMINYMKKVTKNHKLNLELRNANVVDNKYVELVDLLVENPNVKNTIKALFEIE